MDTEAVAPALEFHDIQSPILRRRPAPYFGSYLHLRIDDPAQGRELVRRIIPHVVSAAEYASRDTWLAVVFTCAGLRALGVPESSLASFPLEFRQGMAQRAQAIGDRGDSAPERWEAPYGTGEIHVALALLSISEQTWRKELEVARRELDGLPGVTLLRREDFAQVPNGRTQLGYKDGISFPNIAGNGVNPIAGGGEPIAAGEFVLGYPGESGHALPTPTPIELGRNGTFLGFRKVHVRVAAFRRFLRENATASLSEEFIAAKMVGRWRSGAPLMLSPERDDPEIAQDVRRLNDFDYADDPAGMRCPAGAHIRRLNPRSAPLVVMTDVNLHRIIRHGATYGPPLPEGVLEDDGIERGIFFIFISARAPSTFEFLKSEWIDNGNFADLGHQMDPIAGDNDGTGTFTIPMRPVRKRLNGLERFTVTRGGEYGFMPSLSALRWLAELADV